MDELPPKAVKAQLVRLDDSLKQIERTQVAGIQRAPGSLPVLEAFQLFLENERRKAQRKMLAISALAVLSILIATASGVFFLRSQMQDTASDLQRISSRTDALADALAEAERRGTEELQVLESRFRDESRRIVEQYSALLDEQQGAGKEDPDQMGAQLETIEERLTRLEAENEHWKSQFSARDPMARPAEQPLQETVVAANHTGSIANVPVTRTEMAGTGSQLILTLIPDGQQQGIRWMLPLRFTQE